MSDAQATIPAPDAPSDALARCLGDLEPSKASALKLAFGAMFDSVEEWSREAANLVVTDESQTGKMSRARSLRLECKRTRVEMDKRRKALKDASLREGRAIDGAYRIFEALVQPLEERLLEAETFAQRAAQTREDALAESRAAALTALGVVALPAGLGRMTEDLWGPVLEDAKAAKTARERAAKEEKEARIEADRILAERRAKEREEAVKREAERVAREAEAHERARVAEEEAAKERAAREAAVREQDRQAEELAKQNRELASQEQALAAERNARAEAETREREARDEAEAAEAEVAKVREKEAADARAKEEAELAPDREKLVRLAAEVRALNATVTAPKAVELVTKIRTRFEKLALEIEKAARAL